MHIFLHLPNLKKPTLKRSNFSPISLLKIKIVLLPDNLRIIQLQIFNRLHHPRIRFIKSINNLSNLLTLCEPLPKLHKNLLCPVRLHLRLRSSLLCLNQFLLRILIQLHQTLSPNKNLRLPTQLIHLLHNLIHKQLIRINLLNQSSHLHCRLLIIKSQLVRLNLFNNINHLFRILRRIQNLLFICEIHSPKFPNTLTHIRKPLIKLLYPFNDRLNPRLNPFNMNITSLTRNIRSNVPTRIGNSNRNRRLITRTLHPLTPLATSAKKIFLFLLVKLLFLPYIRRSLSILFSKSKHFSPLFFPLRHSLLAHKTILLLNLINFFL